ncbi:PH and SEC7 domain-containing protein 4 [Cricetulus griseus]|uniref:PH and SEC7 domain-containing protein 4 n=1 Tax=Cricetulus griseus TaxID=10029 RepID=G3IEU0_CRIGR|nr:PH and SEC7 domain-containing protein 4 [Cricetulus griseus]
MEFLNIHLEDNLQPRPGTHPNKIHGHPGPSEPSQEHSWPFDPPESTRTDAHHGSSGVETTRLGSCPFEGEARQTPASLCSGGDNRSLGSPQQQNPSSSTQVVFWAGILQAQMCVLDLEEELEKTEGLKAELRCCIPPPTKDFLSDVGLSPSLHKEDEDPGDDSSEPEEENQAWPREQMPGSSPEWGAEEDSIFFDNPLFLESPVSDTSTEGECFSWGYPDSHPDMKPHSPQALHSSLQEDTGLSGPGSELDLGSSTADHSGCATPPFPVPSYKLHPCLALESIEGVPIVPPDQEGEGSQTPQSLLDLAPPRSKDLQTEDPSRPQEPLTSQNGGEKDAGCFQEPVPCTLAPCGSQTSSLEPSRPSPVSSQKGSPQIELHSPKWPQDASYPLLPEKDESKLSSLKIEETEEAPNLRQEAECEDPARTEGDSAARYHVRLTSAEGNDFSRAVAEAYLSFFHFEGQSLDRALRGFLQALVLSGETQERERILYQFSKRFHYCNPGAFPSVDLHGQNIGKSMSCQEFITNLNGLQDGRNFPKELLKALYWSIRSEKLEWAVDEEDAARPEKDQPSPSAGKISSPFLQMAQDPTVPTYKQGILARKMHHDADGKKTPWGKRGWKMFHTLLRGMVLYFLKGEDPWLDGQSLVGNLVDEPVGVHHSLASPATHYTKRPYVFQLRTADWRLYLFQAPTAKEMASWIARINLAAATHSAPPFPAAVGSQRRFVRPILPMSPAQSSLEEQHRSHENCLDAASDDLLDLQRNLPERRGRSRELEEYRLRKEYLEHEKTRYETYVQLLVSRLHFPLGDLALWEDQLGREAEGTPELKPSLKKSHSSPSLHQEEAPTTAKVKRNISERRTYRKIIPKRNRNQL